MGDPIRKLLVIDDEEDVFHIVKERFAPLGFETHSAKEGQEAFPLVEEYLPGCILLDIRMPQGEDGLTFLRKLRSFRHEDPDKEDQVRKIPVIILTGAGNAMKSLFELEGIHSFFQKPFDLAKLQGAIEDAVGL